MVIYNTHTHTHTHRILSKINKDTLGPHTNTQTNTQTHTHTYIHTHTHTHTHRIIHIDRQHNNTDHHSIPTQTTYTATKRASKKSNKSP